MAPEAAPRREAVKAGAAKGAEKATAPSACVPERKKTVSVGPEEKAVSSLPAAAFAGVQPRLDETNVVPGAQEAHEEGDARYE